VKGRRIVTTTRELFRQGRTDQVWRQYCGFLSLSLDEFMEIQRSLLMEQIGLLSRCELGRKVMGNTVPHNVEEFRELVPLTTYEDYAPYLDERREDVLPAKPYMWAHTGGTTGVWKWVPLTKRTHDLYAEYSLAMLMLASSEGPGHFTIADQDVLLYVAAPPPYISGIGIEAIGEILDFRYVPSLNRVRDMGFRERVQWGFAQSLQTGIDITGGLAGVMARTGRSFGERNGDLKSLLHPAAAARVLRAVIKSRRAGRPMMPRDMWRLKALLCSGMDVAAFRDEVKHYWGVDPLEMYSITEFGGLLAMQTWSRKGMTFTPDVGFFEFIPERDSLISRDDPSYEPPTVLMDELEAGQRYETVFTNLHGGIMTRYRPGDLIKIVALEDEETGIRLPQMVFEARADRIIDIGGFSRLNERIVWQALEGLDIEYEDWMARKEFASAQPVLRIYLATDNGKVEQLEARIHEALKALDKDYADLESMLDMNPLRLTLLPAGTFARYAELREAEGVDMAHQKPPHMQPSDEIVDTMLRLAQQ
jgi:hypothetical protein